jgi:hypothetical protein
MNTFNEALRDCLSGAPAWVRLEEICRTDPDAASRGALENCTDAALSAVRNPEYPSAEKECAAHFLVYHGRAASLESALPALTSAFGHGSEFHVAALARMGRKPEALALFQSESPAWRSGSAQGMAWFLSRL